AERGDRVIHAGVENRHRLADPGDAGRVRRVASDEGLRSLRARLETPAGLVERDPRDVGAVREADDAVAGGGPGEDREALGVVSNPELALREGADETLLSRQPGDPPRRLGRRGWAAGARF